MILYPRVSHPSRYFNNNMNCTEKKKKNVYITRWKFVQYTRDVKQKRSAINKYLEHLANKYDSNYVAGCSFVLSFKILLIT